MDGARRMRISLQVIPGSSRELRELGLSFDVMVPNLWLSLTALFAAMVSIGLGLSLVLLGNTETALAGHDRDARALRFASRAAASLAISELRRLPSLRDVGLEGARRRCRPRLAVSSTRR